MSRPMPLLLIGVNDLQDWWPLIAPRVTALSKGNEWEPGHVLRLLSKGDAELWATPGAEGFVIVSVHVAPWERVLMVWIGCNGESGALSPAYVPQVQAIARLHKCGRFEWESERAGYQRAFRGVRTRYLYSMEA